MLQTGNKGTIIKHYFACRRQARRKEGFSMAEEVKAAVAESEGKNFIDAFIEEDIA